MKTSILKRVSSACMALAIGCTMALGLATTPVKAELVDGSYVKDNDTRITKKLTMTEQTNLPEGGLTFKFNINKVSYNGNTAPEELNKMPDISSVEIAINEDIQPTMNADGTKTYTKETDESILNNFMFVGNTGEHSGAKVGEYVYEVKEEQSLGGNNIPYHGENRSHSIEYSQETYTITIRVLSDVINGTHFNAIVIVKNSQGTKVDPNPGKYGMTFENTYIKTVKNDALKITKNVVDAFGDATTNTFDFTLSINKVATVANPTASNYKIVKADGTEGTEGIITPGGEAITFQLSAGDYLQVNNLIVGTPYTITEKGTAGFTPSYTVNGNQKVDGKKDEDITINQNIQDVNINDVIVTNTFNSQTPTGIIMNNLPFISMVVLGLGALTLVVVTNSRKRANRA